MKKPMVYLIGAGPGDPWLITARGLRYLRLADVVLYDHLVHPRLLRYARADAERIDVGPAAPEAMDEQVELAHHAQDRSGFARGALVAARWVVGRPAGLYSMMDVLGL